MSHDISVVNGKVELAYSGQTPWHGLARAKFDTPQPASVMLPAAGLDWEVATSPAFISIPAGNAPGVSIPAVGIYRKDTGVVLGFASSQYVPVQNLQAGEIADFLVTEGGAHTEVAGALGNGERCWLLAHIPHDFEVVRGDMVKTYFLLAWGHDGKHGIAGKLTPVRVVCQNTLSMALGAQWSRSADIYFRHVGNVMVKLDAAREALGLVKKQAERTAEAYKTLAATALTRDEAMAYFGDVFPGPARIAASSENAEARSLYEQRLSKWLAHQDTVLGLYETGGGADIPGVRGTAWGAYNAVTEWVDHVYPVLKSGQVSETRQRAVAFGTYAEVKQEALHKALALIG